MACLGVEPGAAGWKAQTNPLSYGGTPKIAYSCCVSLGGNLDFPGVLQKSFITSTTGPDIKEWSRHGLMVRFTNYATMCSTQAHLQLIYGAPFPQFVIKSFETISVTRKNRQMLPKSSPKMISLEKWSILTPLQNLPKIWELWEN